MAGNMARGGAESRSIKRNELISRVVINLNEHINPVSEIPQLLRIFRSLEYPKGYNASQ